jgi:16S rRNA C967 or C1407 C5-methylase (RsmB/RsmF family)/NOL1/NOP2/fmu family ribosome biogenesis protein
VNADFEQRMAGLLGPELPAFLESMQQPPVRGLRINPGKVDADELSRLLGVSLTPVRWSETGFLLPQDAPSLGWHPAIDCGLFYLQDPSSMLAPSVLAPEPGWRVADVAAAPGGKTTDLAARVGDGGLVLANEVVRSRLRLLESTLDRWGSRAAVTSSSELERLAGVWDGVLLDAPCTGEALFRRDADAARGWSEASVLGNARRQAHLLDAVAPLVRPGGVLVYSTCSFEMAEDEEQVARFLDRHAGWELDDALVDDSLAAGMPFGGADTKLTARVWPHRCPGDGQFVARLVRTGEGPVREPQPSSPRRPDRALLAAWRAFRESAVPGFEVDEDAIVARGDSLYLLPDGARGLHLARPGLPLGRSRPGRFEPAHGLATAVAVGDAADRVRCSDAYLQGETVPDPGPDGWVLICFERWGLGWARRSRGVLKNFFPKGLRRTARSVPR